MKVISEKTNTKFDYLFVCESKVRELESCCLIGQELEKRGYSVGIVSAWNKYIDERFRPIKTEVLMAHCAYTDYALNQELEYVDGAAKVIHLQWEQLYSIKDLTNPKAPWKISGKALLAKHLSWGNDNYNKLIEYDGVTPDNVDIAGHVAMDFLRPEFRSFYLSRRDILSKYNIPGDKKICLFVSSFSYVNYPENSRDEEFDDFWRISVDSQKVILQWIEKIISENDHLFFVYRPHPAEAESESLKSIEDKYANFSVISDYSVKQWILVSDIIYNWYSTSLAEMYFAGKSCFILRPFEFPKELECKLFENGEFITSFDEFEASFDKEGCNLPVPLNNITSSYYYDKDEPVYVRIANICEDVFKSDFEYLKTDNRVDSGKAFRCVIKSSFIGKVLLSIKHKIESFAPENETMRQNREYEKYINDMAKKNLFSQDEVDSIIAIIQKCV